MKKGINLVIFLISLSAFVSITLFEAFLVILLIYYTLYLLKNRELPKGILFKPLVMYAVPTFLSALFYTPWYINKGIERSFFMFIYPIGGYARRSEKFFYRLNMMLLSIGYILIPVVIYRFYKTGQPAPVWGGWFEVGIFYSIFSLSALSLFIKDKKYVYLVSFFLFVCFVLLSMRRSAILSLVISLFIFAFLMRKHLSFRSVVISSLMLLSMVGFSFYILIKKDERFSTLYQVITGQKPLNEETLNKISSLRWQNFKAGVEVIKRDLSERNFLPLLIGHGVNPGFELEPKSQISGAYESVLFISVLIENGILGLSGIAYLYTKYYTFVMRFRLSRENIFVVPFLLTPSLIFVGSIFTGFWDALLPLYLVWFRMVEEEQKA